jgi:predicted transcriptional regulator
LTPLEDVIADIAGEDAPRNTHPKARERDEAILAMLGEGPKTTTQIADVLDLGDGARQILTRLAQRGKIKPEGRTSEQGGAVLWSLMEGPAKVPVGMPAPSEDAVLAALGPMFSSTREVGEAVGATTQAVRRVLEALDEKGAVVKQEGAPLKWRLPDAQNSPSAELEPVAHASDQSRASDSASSDEEANQEVGETIPYDQLAAALDSWFEHNGTRVLEEWLARKQGDGSGSLPWDVGFDAGAEAISQMLTDEWLEVRGKELIEGWLNSTLPRKLTPQAEAYVNALLELLGKSRAEYDSFPALCDRIERVIWGHALGG